MYIIRDIASLIEQLMMLQYLLQLPKWHLRVTHDERSHGTSVSQVRLLLFPPSKAVHQRTELHAVNTHQLTPRYAATLMYQADSI